MPVNVGRTLRQALVKLTGERDRLDRQIGAIGVALNALDGRPRAARGPRRMATKKVKRPRMSAAGRKAVSQRMKAYWAKRQARKRAKIGKKKATVAAQGE